MNIVIVEDEIKIRNGLSRLLSSYGEHEVIAKAKNGREGLETIESLHPDLVFTDIKMPEMDGLQMLEEIKNRQIKCHSVILTGYAEFDYAKRAITCGADDYLLKPITVDAVDGVLKSISAKISAEATRIDADPASYIRAIVSGALENNDENIGKAERIFELSKGYELCFLRGYSTSGCFDKTTVMEKFKEYKGLYVSEDNKDLFMLYDKSTSKYSSDEEIVAMLNRRIDVVDCLKDSVWYVASLSGLKDLKDIALKSDKKFLFGEMLDTRIVIEGSTDIVYTDYKYSKDTEKEIEKILVNNDEEGWQKWSEGFAKGFIGKAYDPYSVRIAYQTLAGFILQLAIKIWPDKGRQLRELDTVEKISRAKLLSEIKGCLDEAAAVVFAGEATRDDIHNYTILKAIAYIRENYANKISQEEVANYLSITPEYLSTLFHREMNKNFSAFVNEFRVSHAKRLLTGSNLKIYEIAEQVGFTDTKYFNRVFKDIEGVSPKEFRER